MWFTSCASYPTTIRDAHLPDVVMALLETKTSETQGRLPTSTVLLGQVHAELVQHISCAKLSYARRGTDNKTDVDTRERRKTVLTREDLNDGSKMGLTKS